MTLSPSDRVANSAGSGGVRRGMLLGTERRGAGGKTRTDGGGSDRERGR